LAKDAENKLVPVKWPTTGDSLFVAGIKIRGDDVPGILKDISNCITSYKNSNIKSINISTNDSMFSGSISVCVSDLEHLNRLIERLKKVGGIYYVERFESTTD
jgi:(p)ppGpp synthase/HD superfamily hydrolase